jgi:hypothetical protein
MKKGMKAPEKAGEKSWAGKVYDKMTAKDEPAMAVAMPEKKVMFDPPVEKKPAPKVAAPVVKPAVKPDVILSDDMKKRAEEEAQKRKDEKEEEAKRRPGRKAGAKFVDEQDYPNNNEIVLASIPTLGMMLLQYRYAPNSVPPKDAAKGDFYANIAGSWSSLVGKVNAWMSIPEF